ncbi:MAG: hypothetical protein LBB13_00235 [Rickettsiales bacterium]|jgi:hypothetical protein|nr:hypothetical protein [Rickettsiales bacterium]
MILTNLKRFMAVALTTLLLSLQTMGNGVYASGLEAKGDEDEEVSTIDMFEALDLTIDFFRGSNSLGIVNKLEENKNIIDFLQDIAKNTASLENNKSSDEDESDESSDEDESDESSDEDDDKPEDKSVSTKDSTDNGGASSLNDSNSLEQQRKKFENTLNTLSSDSNFISNMTKALSSNENLRKDYSSFFFKIAENFGVTEKNFEEFTENSGMPDVSIFIKNNFKKPATGDALSIIMNKIMFDKGAFENILNVTPNLSESK